MQDSSGKLTNKSIFADLCEVSFGKFLPFIQPMEAATVLFTCKNDLRQNIITCKDRSLDAFINEVGGLEFNVRLLTQNINLPHYIPILDYGTIAKVRLPKSIEYVGISLKDIIKSGFHHNAGRMHEYPNITYRSSLLEHENLKDKKVILFLCGEDTLIEGVWYKRNKSKLFETLKQMNFYAVTGINFSVFGDECALAQNLNLKRSLYSSYLLEQNNIKPIPHLYALNSYQIDRWIQWFKENPKVKYFTINCQFQKSKTSIETVVKAIDCILSELIYLHAILQGFQFTKIYKFGHLVNRIHFAEKKAVKYSMGHRSLKYDKIKQSLITTQQNSKLKKIDKSKLLIENIHTRKKQLQVLMSNNIETC
jgi:hypothetical protein